MNLTPVTVIKPQLTARAPRVDRMVQSIEVLTRYLNGDSKQLDNVARSIAVIQGALMQGSNTSRYQQRCKRLVCALQPELRNILSAAATAKKDRLRTRAVGQFLLQTFIAAKHKLPFQKSVKDCFGQVLPKGSNRIRELAAFKGGNLKAAARFCLMELESIARLQAGEEIGARAITKAFSQKEDIDTSLAALATGFHMAHRNSFLHAQGESSAVPPYAEISECATYLISLISPREGLEYLSEPITQDLHNGIRRHLSHHPRIIDAYSSGQKISPQLLLTLEQKGAMSEAEWLKADFPQDYLRIATQKALEQGLVTREEVFRSVTKEILETLEVIAGEALQKQGVRISRNQRALKLLRNPEIGRNFFSSDNEYAGWQAILSNLTTVAECHGASHDGSFFIGALASLLAKKLDGQHQQGHHHHAQSLKTRVREKLDSGHSIAEAILDFSIEIEARFVDIADQAVLKDLPAALQTKPKGVAPEQYARRIAFNMPRSVERLAEHGISAEQFPILEGLVSSLFFTIKTSWVHTTQSAPEKSATGELLVACDLLHRLVDIVEGIPAPQWDKKQKVTTADTALLLSFNPSLFNSTAKLLLGDISLSEASRRVEKFFTIEQTALFTEELPATDQKLRLVMASQLRQGLDLIASTDILPPGDTVTGVTTRLGLASIIQNLTMRLSDEDCYPLWRLYCPA